ncbi:hypothetical protein B0H17DRAFT_1218863 [Mycena rosella]|uniref:Uncharacterized protein n=1 Tax=Mycena rosella TaxID=1033263 RepID=A0AAD7BM31_MYCRO|nr:hypothetical protein B0H17DRAFT_1218863 [Mycena rosella]
MSEFLASERVKNNATFEHPLHVENDVDMDLDPWVDEPPLPPPPPLPPILIPVPAPIHECTISCGKPITATIQCLYITHPEQVQVATCSCMPPRTGVSVDLLEIYRALFERFCDAIATLAAALHTIYDRRGFRVISNRNLGQLAKDPFVKDSHRLTGCCGSSAFPPCHCWTHGTDRMRRGGRGGGGSGGGEAAQVAGTAGTEAEEAAQVAEAAKAAQVAGTAGTEAAEVAQVAHSNDLDEPPTPPSPKPGCAHRKLRERCPACFGLETWGVRCLKGVIFNLVLMGASATDI